MTGWSANGNTRPFWRSCLHENVQGDRCGDCNARRVHSEPQQRDGHAAVPLGSPLLIRPDLGAMHMAGPARVAATTYNGPVRVADCPKCERPMSSANMARHVRSCAA